MGPFARVLSLYRRRGRGTTLASNHRDVPGLGPLTRRVHGVSASDWLYVQRQAEKWFGPFNPRVIPDSVLKIMSTDWSIGFAREIWLSAFHAVDYRVEGGTAKIAAFVEQCVERHRWQWIEVMLRALDYGRQACELVWSAEDVAYTYAEADRPGEAAAREATLPGAYVLGELRDLDPEAVEILADEKTGDYAGLRYEGIVVPGRKTLLVTNEPEFGGLLGRSLNVRAYNPWWWANLAYLGLNRYLERKGDPPLIGFAPGEEVADARGNSQDPVHVTATGLANLKSGGAYVFPQEFDPDSKQPLYAVRALEVAERAPEFLSTIDRYEHNKKLAWLIPGSLGTGASFASDKVSQQLLHRMFDRRLQRLILDPLNKHVIPKLVRYNFGDVPASAYPRLAAGSMAENAREVFAELLRAALNLETIAPDGRAVRIAQMIDWAKGLRTLNLPRVDASLIPDAPDMETGGFPTAGRPPRIARERDRANAPSRPGLTRALPFARTTGKITAGVFIPVPEPAASQFPAKPEDPSPPHITVLYVGEIAPEDRSALARMVRVATRWASPFEVEMTDYGEFKNDDGATIAHMIPRTNGDEIAALHGSLRRFLEDAGFAVAHHDGPFKPHATLGYVPAGEQYGGPRPAASWQVSNVEVWVSDGEGPPERVAIPLRGAVVTALASAPQTAGDWLDGVLAGFGRIDDAVAATERLVERERVSIEAEIRNLYAKAVARARTSDGRLDARNRTLAAELGRQVESMLEQSMFGDLLDESEITPGALGLARGPRTPLAAQHGKAFEAAGGTLEAAGAPTPGRAAGVRIVKDVIRDAKSNGRGVVTRETRRVSEELDRMIMAEAPAADAEAAADRYELRERDYKASTVDHVRATARATLTHSGAQAEADAWAVLAGPSSEATVLERFPRGQVADHLYTVKTTADLDALYRRIVVDEARPGTSWRNLGLTFGSQEMYVPIPRGPSALAIIALIGAKRAEWNRRREERQLEVGRAKESAGHAQALAREGQGEVATALLEGLKAVAAAAKTIGEKPPAVVNVPPAVVSVSPTPVQVLPAPPTPVQVLPAPPTPIQVLPAPSAIEVLPAPPTPVQILPAPPTPIQVTPTIEAKLNPSPLVRETWIDRDAKGQISHTVSRERPREES